MFGGKRILNGKALAILFMAVCLLLFTTTTAGAEPGIKAVYPAHLSQQDQTGIVSATVYDVTAVTRLSIDGKDVIPALSADTVTYAQSFTPGLHYIYLAVTDSTGQTVEKAWEFYVNDPANPYMLPGSANCEKCHPNTWQNQPGHLVDLTMPSGSGGHPYSCGACHYYKATESKLIVRADGSFQITTCVDCHTAHNGMGGGGPMLLPLRHGSTDWKGTWPAADNTIKAPRVSFDCQYCHQPGTKVRLGHDLVSDHAVDEPACTSCHSEIMTVVHNKNGRTCSTCHESPDPAVQSAAGAPAVAKAGSHTAYAIINNRTKVSTVQEYNDLNLSVVSLTVYGPNNEAVSPEWTPGPGLLIKRVYVEGWNAADRQYMLAYVERENKWYTLPVADEGKVLYGRSPAASTARLIYLPKGTTKIKTVVKSGPGDSTYSAGLQVKAAYYNRPAKCTDCHAQSTHEGVHAVPVDAKCLNCHIGSLTQEHMNNQITQKQALTCDACHKSSSPAVQGAVLTANKQCAACHRQSHNMNILEAVYGDIPLYSGFVWSAPQDARMWAGEPWMPEEFLAAGKVIISNRRTDVTGDAVWSFYQTELTAKGWSLVTAVPAAGSDYYSATFTKGISKIVLWFYGGEGHTPSPVPAAGYRVEILYK